MSTPSRDRISVDLRGLRAALFEQARAQGVSPSGFVRSALSKVIKPVETTPVHVGQRASDESSGRARVSLRMSRADAQALLRAAGSAGQPPGALVAAWAAGAPVTASSTERQTRLAALVASTSEL